MKSALWDPHHEGDLVVADAEQLYVFQVGGPLGDVARERMLCQRSLGTLPISVEDVETSPLSF